MGEPDVALATQAAYGPAVVDGIVKGKGGVEGREIVRTEYSCGHPLYDSDRAVTPARCPVCGEPLYG